MIRKSKPNPLEPDLASILDSSLAVDMTVGSRTTVARALNPELVVGLQDQVDIARSNGGFLRPRALSGSPQGWSRSYESVGLLELLHASWRDALDQGQLTHPRPSLFLVDDPADLPVI